MPGLLLSGIAIGVAVAAPIGPVNIAVIRRGLSRGFYPAWMLGLGAGVADACYVVLVYLGLAPIISQSLAFRLILWGAGGAFLIYLGLSGLRAKDTQSIGEGAPPKAELHPFFTGLGITLLNPMTVVSWLVIGGAFFSSITLGQDIAGGAFFVLGIFLGSILWSGSVALTTHFARRFVNSRVLSAVSIIASLALIAFGLGFFLQAAQAFRG